MASVRKKYNAAAKAQQHRARVLRLADFKIRNALKGVTVAYNNSWEYEERLCECGKKIIPKAKTCSCGKEIPPIEFYTTGMGRIIDLLKGDIETACGTLVQIDIRWRVYITIYCVTQDGEDYMCLLPVINKVCQMQRLEDEIEQIIIPAALKTLNPAHIKDFGYWGEVL